MSFVDGGGRDRGHRERAGRRLPGAAAWSSSLPFPRLTYDEAMARFGTDRPDLRFGLEIRDLGDAAARDRVQGLPRRAEGGGVVRGLNAGARELSRAELDGLIEFAQGQGAGGLVWAYVEEGEAPSLALAGGEVLPPPSRGRSSRRLEASPGDLLLLVADDPGVAAQTLGALRIELARRFELADADDWKPVWVTDFPLVEWNDDEGRWDALAPPLHGSPAEDSLDAARGQPGHGRGRAPTTSSSTARRSAAAASVSTARTSSTRCSRRSGMTRQRPTRSSAS